MIKGRDYLPANAQGSFSDQEQTITYTYVKIVDSIDPVDPVKPTKPVVNKVDTNIDKNVSKKTLKSNESSLPKAGENSMDTIKLAVWGSLFIVVSLFMFGKQKKKIK